MSAIAEQIFSDIAEPIATRLGYMGFGALGALALNDGALDSVDPRIAMGYGAAYGLVAPLITSLSNVVFGQPASTLDKIVKCAIEVFASAMICVACMETLGFTIGYEVPIVLALMHKTPFMVDRFSQGLESLGDCFDGVFA